MAIKESKAVIKEVLEYWKQELESKQNPSEKSNLITRKTERLEKLITQLDNDKIKPKDLRKIDQRINGMVILSLKAKNPELADKLSQMYEKEEVFKDKESRETYHNKKMLLSFDDKQLSKLTEFTKEKTEEKKEEYQNLSNAIIPTPILGITFMLLTYVSTLALASVAPIGIAIAAGASALFVAKTGFDYKQDLAIVQEEISLKSEYLTDISQALETKQKKTHGIEPELQQELSSSIKAKPSNLQETDPQAPSNDSHVDRLDKEQTQKSSIYR